MKKRMNQWLVLLMAVLAVGTTACGGDDDNDGGANGTASALVGTWLMVKGAPAGFSVKYWVRGFTFLPNGNYYEYYDGVPGKSTGYVTEGNLDEMRAAIEENRSRQDNDKEATYSWTVSGNILTTKVAGLIGGKSKDDRYYEEDIYTYKYEIHGQTLMLYTSTEDVRLVDGHVPEDTNGDGWFDEPYLTLQKYDF